VTDKRFDVDATPDVNEIDRTPAADRPNRIPSLNAVQWDNKKMIVGAALGGAAIFTILTLITGSGGNNQAIQSKRKAPPAAAEAPMILIRSLRRRWRPRHAIRMLRPARWRSGASNRT
jgi:type IV secretion system protein VirB10